MERMLFEIPEENENVIYAGRAIQIDGKSVAEIHRYSTCAKDLLSTWGLEYCVKHWLNPVFYFRKNDVPTLIGFVFDENPPDPSSFSRILQPA